MPISVKSAERQTGHRIIPLYGSGKDDLVQVGWLARESSGIEVTRAYAKVSKDGSITESALHASLKRLCEQAYKIHCGIVAMLQENRCKFCGERKPLEFDHIRMRSHGRSDEVSNLRALCPDCHRRRHRENIA